jgi:hypothetical protein
MKALYLLIVVLFIIPLSSSAIVKNNRNDLRNYKTELNLTSQQLSQLDAIYSSFQAKAKLQAPQATRQQNAKLRQERRKQFRMEVAKVLTDEQIAKLKEMIQASRANQ